MQISSSLILASTLLLASPILAQNDGNDLPPLSSETARGSEEPTSEGGASGTTLAEASNTDSASESDDTAAASTAAASTAAESTAAESSAAQSTAADSTITAPPSSMPAATTDAPYDGITNAPKLSDFFSYPAPSVPPTVNAPFMQKSTLPSGTVFIAVGAALGFLFFLMLAWRAVVAYLLHRRIERRNSPFANISKKAIFGSGVDGKTTTAGGAGRPFYTHVPGSALSLDPLTSSGGASGGTKHSYRTSATPSSLFFSPTAGAGMHGPNSSSTGPANRSSGYLPAGYYAASASAAGGGLAGNGRPISMADFAGGGNAPQNQGYQRARSVAGPSEPGSPNLGTMQQQQQHQFPELPHGRPSTGRMSTVSLGTKSEGRAPSAYLEDLFDAPPVSREGERRF